MNTLTAMVFTYGPYFAVFGFAAARLHRWGILRNRLLPAVQPVGAPAELALVIGLVTLLTGHLTTAVAPGAMKALLADPDRTAVIETIGLVGALLFAWGVGARLRARLRAARAGQPGQWRAAGVLGVLFAMCLSGVALTVSYRWITVWYAYISVPYLRSLLVLDPNVDAIVASPLLSQVHMMLFMTFLAAWPTAGLPLDEIFPLRDVARRFAEAVPASPAAGKAETP